MVHAGASDESAPEGPGLDEDITEVAEDDKEGLIEDDNTVVVAGPD